MLAFSLAVTFAAIAILFPHGLKNATVDTQRIKDGFDAFPNANIAIVPDGYLLVIDVDGEEGEKSIGRLKLAVTATAKTGRGRHLYFHCDGLENWKPEKLKGVDFRFNANGYVVVPPSRHQSGKRYRWQDDEKEAVKLDISLIKAKRVIQIDGKIFNPKIAVGSRNNDLTSIAGFMRAKGLSQSSIEESLIAINENGLTKPLAKAEVLTIARSVARYPATAEKMFGDMAEVKVEPVTWLYSPYMPIGVVVMLDGRPGLGKSNFAMAIIAALTTGAKVPWSPDQPRAKALILSAEDDAARILKPRLLANGAKLAEGDRKSVV